MTQTPTTPIRFRVYGKDRLFDSWVPQDFGTREEAQAWLDRRAWIRYDSDGNPLIEAWTREARVRLEWINRSGEWEAYTAWYAPEHRNHLLGSSVANAAALSRQTMRLVSEDSPERAQD